MVTSAMTESPWPCSGRSSSRPTCGGARRRPSPPRRACAGDGRAATAWSQRARRAHWQTGSGLRRSTSTMCTRTGSDSAFAVRARRSASSAGRSPARGGQQSAADGPGSTGSETLISTTVGVSHRAGTVPAHIDIRQCELRGAHGGCGLIERVTLGEFLDRPRGAVGEARGKRADRARRPAAGLGRPRRWH